MTAANIHIIQKQIFNLLISSELGAFELQQRVSSICEGQLNSALDKLFSRFVSSDKLVAIEKLEIDIGAISPRYLEDELVPKIISEIEKQLPIQLLEGTSGTKITTPSQNKLKLWLQFLKTGTMPWQAAKISEREIMESVLETVASNSTAAKKVKYIFQKNPIAVQRLVWQYPISFLEKLIGAVAGSQNFDFQKKYKTLERLIFSMDKKELPVSFVKNWNRLGKKKLENIFWKYVVTQTMLGQEKVVVFENVIRQTIREMVRQVLRNDFLGKEFLQFVNVLLQEIRKKRSSEFRELVLVLKKIKTENTESSEREKKSKKKKSLSDLKNKTIDLQKSKSDSKIDSESSSKIEKSREEQPKQKKSSSPIDGEEIEKGISKKGAAEKSDEKEDAVFLEKEELPTASTLENVPVGTEYYVSNAGLVLAHPFLSRLFDELKLLEKNRFKNETARYRAVHLLRYLAVGETPLPEYEISFLKFLCGLPFNAPLEREVVFSAIEKEECDHLLETIIKHWGALGNASPDALREGFLQRSGKLSKQESGWLLQVEGKSIDLLLDKLPWGKSMVQLSWMKELLKIEWN